MLKALKNFNAKIVCEKTLPFSGLVNGKLYLIAENSDFSADALEVCISDFKSSLSKNTLIYSYEVCVIENVDTELSGSPLHDAVHRGYNVIIPLYISSDERVYMVAKVDVDKLDMQVPFIVTQAEDITKCAVKGAIKNIALQNPMAFESLLYYLFDSLESRRPRLKDKLLHGISFGLLGNHCCMAHSVITFQESESISGRFVQNAKLIDEIKQVKDKNEVQKKKLKNAERELDYILQLYQPDVYREFVLLVATMGIEAAFDTCLNRSELAAKSQIKVSVEAIRKDVVIKTNNKQKTNGTFRVYLTKGSKTEQVVFKRRASCIIYIMYLIDRKKRGDQVDTISIKDNEELFMKLYSYVYPDQKEIDFVAITTKSDGGSRLPNYFTDIRDALYDALGKFGDSPLPFYIPNSNSHITVRSENIKITKELKDLNLKV